MLSDLGQRRHTDPCVFLVSHVASRDLPSCNPATTHEVKADWKLKKPTPTSPSFCHTCKSVRSNTCRLHENVCSPQNLPRTGPKHLCWRNQINSGANLLLSSVPGCRQEHRSITYRKLINTSILLLVRAKNAERCGCQDYLSVSEKTEPSGCQSCVY